MLKETSFGGIEQGPAEAVAGPSAAAATAAVAAVEVAPVRSKPQPRVSKQSRPYVAFKFVECAFCIVCLVVGRENWQAMVIRGNVHLALQPVIAGATFVVYCPLLLISYALNRPPTPFLMACMAALGSVYFIFAAITTGVFWSDLALLLDELDGATPILELEDLQKLLEATGADPDPRLAADRLLLYCMIATPTAAIFLGDLLLTLKYAILRHIPASTLPPSLSFF
ncbi:uncharacterized protein LOC135941812 [Cloeon dipterum]|uniref:uncharacterized protein LOC135941812 n=1 Tax=Cloeon dipterum TaxID=197152 RepID=UPI00321F8435